MQLQNLVASIACGLLLAGIARAEEPLNFYSFVEETKIKGVFVQRDGDLYFNSEKGGTYNYGYIGRFCPTSGQITVLHAFPSLTKAKGLAAVGDEMWFVTETNGASRFGYVGCFNPVNNTVEELVSFPGHTLAKSAPFVLGTNGFHFFTEAGGTHGTGALMRYARADGLVMVCSFIPSTGIKPEAQPVFYHDTLYFGGREGGDLTQQSGKGAGTVGTIDLATGFITKLFDLNAVNHGSRIKALLPSDDRIYYATDEGGDLSLNGGKGSGAMGYFDPDTLEVTRLLVCNGTTTGIKPKGLVAVEDRVYFNCGEGGTNGCGTFYVITEGTNLSRITTLGIPFGNKSDMLTPYGNRLFCATEQGCSNWLGGISAFEVDIAPRELAVHAKNGLMQIAWDTLANDCVLEYAPTLDGAWQPVVGPGKTNAMMEFIDPVGFYRLRR